jgi:hypothetical protein
MYPIQITLSPGKHPDSFKIFSSQYKKWTRGLESFDVILQFVWITPNPPSIEEHERNVSIEEINKDIWDKYLEAKEYQASKGALELDSEEAVVTT